MTVVMEDTVLEPGTIIRCKTCYDADIEGEVTAFDISKRAVLLGKNIPQVSSVLCG